MNRTYIAALTAASLLVAVGSAWCQETGPALTAGPPGTSPAELGLPEVTDDATPQELFAEVKAAAETEDPNVAQEAAQYFSLYGPFRFPNDALYDVVKNRPRTDSIFGIDISHWTEPSFPVEQLARKSAFYLYMKAGQGLGVDGSFAGFWRRAGALPKGAEVHRGAYFFLTCGDPAVDGAKWGERQADVFIKIVKANGGLGATDLPPTVDLEWDKTATERDRWKCRKPDDIIATTNAFLNKVRSAFNRTPMLYTARSWWRERMGDERKFSQLANAKIWLADYSKSSRSDEIPNSIGGAKHHLWQFTETATMASGYNKALDANVFKGTKAEFLQALDIEDFK